MFTALIPSCLQIEQDFSLMFGDAISARFLEKWPTVYKSKVLQQSQGLTQTAKLQNLVQNAESTEVENGMLESTIIKKVGTVFDGEVEGLLLE